MRYLLVGLLIGLSLNPATTRAENQTVSLARYLSLANEQGFDIIYSTALVRPRFKVTFETEQPITRDKLLDVLHAYQLDLKPAQGDRLLVVRRPVEVRGPIDPLTFPDTVAIEEIVVTSSLHEFKLNHVTPAMHLDRESLKNRAVVANDAFRVTSRLPGAASNGVSSRSAIRGGRENETLILLDGMRLYEPFHLNRFNQLFSVLDNRLVSSLDFITGGFPARYGDRLSGVLDIETVRPAELEPFTELGMGLYTASWLQSGSLMGQDYLLSVRRSTIDLIGRLAETELGSPAFSDLYFSMDSELGTGTRLSTSLLWFGDDITINNSSETEAAHSTYGNTYLWFTLQRERANGSTAETRLGFATIKDDREGYVEKPGMVSGELEDDQEFRVYLLNHSEVLYLGRSRLEIGAGYRYLDAEYGFESELSIDPAFAGISNYMRPAEIDLHRSYYGSHASLYASLKIPLARSIYVEAGLRADSQDYVEGSFQTEVTPRFSLLIHPFLGGDLRASWGEFNQVPGIHELDISDGVDTFPAPQEATHRVLSYARPLGAMDLRLDLYHKKTWNTAPYFENLSQTLTLVPELQVDRWLVTPGSVTARGVELSLSGIQGRNEWWFNYTRAEVEETVNGRSVRRSADQKHSANLGLSRKLRDWQVTAEASYHSGWPTTRLALNSPAPPVRNSLRLPDYLSVDIKLHRRWQLNNSELRLELGITNLLNRENQVGSSYAMKGSELVESSTSALPIAPFADVFWRF